MGISIPFKDTKSYRGELSQKILENEALKNNKNQFQGASSKECGVKFEREILEAIQWVSIK